jgi:hypothetical protein
MRNPPPVPPRLDTLQAYMKGSAVGFRAGLYVGYIRASAAPITYMAVGAAFVMLLPALSRWIGQ